MKITEKLDRGQITSSQSVDSIKKQSLFIHKEATRTEKERYELWDGKLEGIMEVSSKDILDRLDQMIRNQTVIMQQLQPIYGSIPAPQDNLNK